MTIIDVVIFPQHYDASASARRRLALAMVYARQCHFKAKAKEFYTSVRSRRRRDLLIISDEHDFKLVNLLFIFKLPRQKPPESDDGGIATMPPRKMTSYITLIIYFRRR